MWAGGRDLTTEATLQPGHWGDIELPLGPNLLKNGDFEKPLSTSVDQGWVTSASRNGGVATLDGDVSYSGSHSLLLQQTVPMVYTPEAFKLPDYGAFVSSGNGGKGGGYGEVVQRVPVTGGKNYVFRFHLRALGFPGGENKDPGPNRGYASLGASVNWIGADGGVWVANHQDSTPNWTTLFEARFNGGGVPTPYTAPVGAKYAEIKLGLSNNHADSLPKAWIDDVEFAEAP